MLFHMYFLNNMKTTTETAGHCYLAVSKQDEEWGLFASGAGYAHIAPHADYPPGGHPSGFSFSWEKGRALRDYALVYITAGNGDFDSKTENKKLAAGDLILLHPGQWHRYRPDPSTGWHEYWICFNGRIAEDLFAQKQFSPEHPVLPIGYNEQITRMFVQALDLAREMPRAFQPRLAAHIMHILALAQAAQQPGRSDDEDLVQRIRCALTEHLDRNISMEDVAADLHISYAKFRRTFKTCQNIAGIGSPANLGIAFDPERQEDHPKQVDHWQGRHPHHHELTGLETAAAGPSEAGHKDQGLE